MKNSKQASVAGVQSKRKGKVIGYIVQQVMDVGENTSYSILPATVWP